MNFLYLSILVNLIIYLTHNKISNFINVYDYPDGKRKIHESKTPLTGGVIIYINFILFFLIYFFENQNLNDNLLFFFENQKNLFLFLLISSSILFLGVYDDKKNLNANLKFFLLFILILILLLLDNTLLLKSLEFDTINFSISFGKYSLFFTLLCFLLFINASNMYDGINLQIGPYFVFIFFVFLIKLNIYLFSSILIVALITFCLLNFNGRTFIGNSGAYFVSFIVGYIFIRQNNLNLNVTVEEIFLVMSLPGLDMFRLFIYRIISKKNPFSADRMHLHHLILNKFNLKSTQITIFLLSVYPFILFQFYKSIYIIIVSVVLYVLIYFYLIKTQRKNDI